MLDAINMISDDAWIEVVLIAVLVVGYASWFMRRHLPSPRWSLIMLEVSVVVVLVTGVYYTLERTES